MNSAVASLVPAFVRRSWALKVGTAIAVVLLVVGGFGIATYLQTGEQLSTNTRAQMQTAATTEATDLSGWVTSTKREAHILTKTTAVQGGEPGEISEYLSHAMEHGTVADEVTSIHYVDTSSGRIEASSSSALEGSSVDELGVPSAEVAPTLPEEGTAITRAFQAPESGTATIAVVASVPNQPDRALVVWYDLAHLARELPRPVQDSFTKVVDSNGVTVISHRTDQILGQNMGGAGVDSMAVKRGLKGETGYMEMPMGGTTMTMGYAPVEGTDWVLMTHSPKPTMFALQRQISQNLLLLLGSALVGFGLVAGLITRDTTRTLDRLTSKAEALESGDLDANLESGRTDEFGRLFGAFGNMRDSLRTSIEEAESARERAEAEREQSARLVEHLETKADEFGEGMERAAEGDLSVRLSPESESAAMTQIGEAFNGMVVELERTMDRIQRFADEVATASEEVTASAEEVESAGEEVSESIQEVSASADEQQVQLQTVAEQMEELSGSIEEVASAANQVAATTEAAAELGADGRESANRAIEKMETLESSTASSVREVESLAAEIDEIGEIVDLISDVADETNILALNASIEASRAGDAGKGFAVVAEEVKALAQEAADATTQIESRIDAIQSAAEDAVEDMQRTNDHVAEGAETIETAIDDLDALAETVEDANVGVQEIDDVTDEQASSTEEVANQVESVSRLAEQSTEAAESVSAAAEEQASSLTEVARNAQSLSSRADTLRSRLESFTVGTSGGEVPGDGLDDRSTAATDGGRPDPDGD